MSRKDAGGNEVLLSGIYRAGRLLVLLASVSASSLIFMSCIRAERPPAPYISGELEEGEVFGGTHTHPIYRIPPRPGSDPAMRRTPARILHRVEPELTEQAAKARVRGVLVAALYVDDQGIVRSVRILKGLPFGLEDKAAEAFGEWRFEPARENGRPVPSVYQATVNFPSKH